MSGHEIQRCAAVRADQLPGSELTHPFGDDWDVHKVRGKVFMLQTEVTGEPIVILKAAPEDALALRESYTQVTPGYHMNKRHWITLHPGDQLDLQLVEDLVTESYLLVVEKLTTRERPVDPETWRPSS